MQEEDDYIIVGNEEYEDDDDDYDDSYNTHKQEWPDGFEIPLKEEFDKAISNIKDAQARILCLKLSRALEQKPPRRQGITSLVHQAMSKAHAKSGIDDDTFTWFMPGSTETIDECLQKEHEREKAEAPKQDVSKFPQLPECMMNAVIDSVNQGTEMIRMENLEKDAEASRLEVLESLRKLQPKTNLRPETKKERIVRKYREEIEKRKGKQGITHNKTSN